MTGAHHIVLALLVLCTCRGVAVGADARGRAKPDSGGAIVQMEPFTVSADSPLSFGFSLRVIRTESPRQLVGMYVDRVQKDSDADRKGLEAGMQIVAIDHRAASSFEPTFAPGSDLAKIFVGRKEGDAVVLDVLAPGKAKPKRLKIVRRTIVMGMPRIGGLPAD